MENGGVGYCGSHDTIAQRAGVVERAVGTELFSGWKMYRVRFVVECRDDPVGQVLVGDKPETAQGRDADAVVGLVVGIDQAGENLLEGGMAELAHRLGDALAEKPKGGRHRLSRLEA